MRNYTYTTGEKFAALAPICGGSDVRNISQIKHIPIWVFHGANDRAVPIYRSAELVAALKKCDADVKFTIYPLTGHDSWTETYHNPKLYQWFLQHRRKD